MPRATANLVPEEKVELKTCTGGFVVLRRLTYGQKLERQSRAAKVSMEVKRSRRQNSRADLDLMQAAATLFDFSHCIVEHNLEDENGQLLNLTNADDISRLDPRVGEEIAVLIDDLNNFEEGEEGNS